MSLYTVLPSTPRLDELVAAVVLGDQSLFPVRENTILYQYVGATQLEEIRKEIFRMVNDIKAAVKWATVKRPRTKPSPFLLTSGYLVTGPDEIAILLPIKAPEALKKTELQIWREEGKDRLRTKLSPGLTLVHPNVCYITPDDVPFYPLFCFITVE
ncbi:hypothetical protein GQ44DRAFT_825651 [Phaeosphaeriaceae sp. PMI808]|nr:hypothetical protein GQ44DRAFT_825651 [Phaeosphaeriaceae sp. PMI808]